MANDVMKLIKDEKGFEKDLRSGKIPVSVHGQGYVGLPLSVLFAIRGIKVVGVSKDKKATEMIKKGKSPIDETDPNSLLRLGARVLPQKCGVDGVELFELESKIFCPMCLRGYEIYEGLPLMKKETVDLKGKLKTLKDYLGEALESGNYEIIDDNMEATRGSDIHIITVPTFANDYSIVLNVCRDIAKGLQKDGDVIINKSTVPVGATDEAEKVVKKNTKKRFGISHMQERIAEGRALKDFLDIPRTVGSKSEEANLVSKALFETLGPPVCMFDDPRITEASKIFENAYRDCNIAIANDYALFCEKLGLNVYDVIEAANTHIKTNVYQPGMVGGHCLPEDTYYVANPLKELNDRNVIMAGRKLNEYIPYHSVELLEKGLGKLEKKIEGSTICIFGVAFKGNTDDTRLTGAKFISEDLKKKGAEVLTYDPWVPADSQKKFGTPVDLNEALDADGIIIAADHTEFYEIDYRKGKYKVLVDMRNIVNNINGLENVGKVVIKFGLSFEKEVPHKSNQHSKGNASEKRKS